MSQKRIEKNFHNRLRSYASIVDDNQLWLEIENSIPKKKKKKRFLIWIAFGLPILVLIGFWLITNNRVDTNEDFVRNYDSIDKTSSSNFNPAIDLTEKSETSEVKTLFERKIIDNKKTRENLREKHQSIDQNITKPVESFQSDDGEIKKNTENKEYVKVQKIRNEMQVQDIYTIPAREKLTSIFNNGTIKVLGKIKKKRRSIKSAKKTKTFIGLSYFAGIVDTRKNISKADTKYVDFGEDYFSHGLSITYGRFINSKLYGKIIISADKSFKKYAAKVTRDTLVPSSTGNQIISSTQYSNGVIDTEFGVPIVKGVYNRDVLNLNTFTSMSVGLGIGYTQPLGSWNLNVETDIQRTIYYDLRGLGRENSSQNIKLLNSFEDYFSFEPKYLFNTQLSVDFVLGKSIILTGGIQYQLGLSSILTEEVKHKEKINLIRASLGLKKNL